MTPGARIAAAAAILDDILAGAPAERALLGWARGSRFAGSGDRAAVRDLVFDGIRRRRSLAWLGGAPGGRGLMIGALRAAGSDPADWMDGQGHALAPPDPDEVGRPLDEAPDAVRLDVPDWLLPRLRRSLGAEADAVCLALAGRAPTTLRVNFGKSSREAAAAALASEGIVTAADPDVRTALRVVERARGIAASRAYREGLVELQDASSQAAVLRLPLRDGDRVLDLCAGGGGKTLAMAALARLDLCAYDARADRMADLPTRARRAGAKVRILDEPGRAAPCALVLVDAPCSGSGTWRRSPDAKWRLTPERLDDLRAIQDDLLDQAAALVAPGGHLAFATCSVLEEEGDERIEAFIARDGGWSQTDRLRLRPTATGDGFFQAVLARR